MTFRTMTTDDLVATLWRDYSASTSQAGRIHALLSARGEVVVNDHVALRTYGLGEVRIDALARTFLAHGWLPRDSYTFADKHLRARWYQHPDPARPKVFVSELDVDELSHGAREIVHGLVAQLPGGFGARDDLPWAGRPWRTSHASYLSLLAESEYAAWMAAFGFRVNHFTVDAGRLRTFDGLPALNRFLADNGFALNEEGGLVKGSPAHGLEQSSTRADVVDVSFEDGVFGVPSCYYEFALRHRLPNGELFQGFVPASADRLFESTDVRR